MLNPIHNFNTHIGVISMDYPTNQKTIGLGLST